MSSARFLAETWGYFRHSSIISTWVMSILRQQYRLIPNSSSTLMGLSPARTRRLNVSHLSAICLPQVKHLTGMIIVSLTCTISVFFVVHLARRTFWVRLLVDLQLALLCRRR